MKPYKAVKPQDTIFRIRTILHDLGIFTTEQHMRNEGMYYSCRVFLDNDDIRRFDIGTNGKGMTAEYSLASAYAELMERIENRMLIYATKYASKTFRQQNKELNVQHFPELSFRYFPDETFREITTDELWLYCQKLLPNVAKYGKNLIEGVTKYKMYFADFFNTTTGEVEHLPYHLLRLAASSTGLCAGNIPEEAILQGLNEIFERFVLQQIYLQRLTPPTIPFEVFEGTEIANRLHRLQAEKGWSIEVKDCSLGKEFPVLGLLLIDRVNNRYAFRLGADLSPIIALQRCFTEAFQGADASERYLQPIILDNDWDMSAEHNQSVVNGMGRFPRELFSTRYSWKFEGFMLKEQCSHKRDLLYIMQWLKANGYTLYIRDNSFLGFPAYHLFIPRLSEIDAKLYNVITDLKVNNDGFFNVKPEYRLQRLSKDEVCSLLEKYKYTTSSEVSLFPYNSHSFNQFNRLLLLALLSYSYGKDKNAYIYMKQFLDEKASIGNKQDVYYYCIRDMFYAKSVNKEDEEILAMLSTIYTDSLVKEVLADMKDRNHVLKNFPIPSCFQCDRCNIRNNCSYPVIVSLENKIQKAQIEHCINQANMNDLFNDI